MQYLQQAGLRLRVHPEDTGPEADLSAVEFAICECGPFRVMSPAAVSRVHSSLRLAEGSSCCFSLETRCLLLPPPMPQAGTRLPGC